MSRHAGSNYQIVAVTDLKPAKRNARTHGKAQVAALVESLRAFGAINPIVVDPQMKIVAGHARWEAAKQLKLDAVPVLQVGHLSEDQLRLYAIADNRIAERAGWDESILAIEFAELEISCPEITLSISGFDLPKIDWLCANQAQQKWTDLDKDWETSPAAPVTESGDLWLLGDRHRLLCGDSTNPEAVARLMGDEHAALVATDPPYNLRAREYSSRGKHKHQDFAMGAGEMSRDSFATFLSSSFEAILPRLMPGALLYAFMDWKHAISFVTSEPIERACFSMSLAYTVTTAKPSISDASTVAPR